MNSKRGHGEQRGRGSSEGHKMGCYTSCAGLELEQQLAPEPEPVDSADGEAAAGGGRAGSAESAAAGAVGGGGGDETVEVHWD